MKIKLLALSVLMASSALATSAAVAGTQPTTKYPVIFAHGMIGYDSLTGGSTGIGSYFGDDLGVYVGKPCVKWYEKAGVTLTCNKHISPNQQSNAFRTSFLNNSEVRGEQLAKYIETYCAMSKPGTSESVCKSDGILRVNMVGHSQGGMDIRKAAKELKLRGISTGALISISSPHRGAPAAVGAISLFSGFQGAQDALVNWINERTSINLSVPSVYANTRTALEPINKLLELSPLGSGTNSKGEKIALAQDARSAAYGMADVDFDPTDGIVTGTQAFNVNYTGTNDALYVASILTAQSTILLRQLPLAVMDPIFPADDGLVDTSSQQMGWRLQYKPGSSCIYSWLCKDVPATFTAVTSLGEVKDLNKPTNDQLTKKDGVLDQDHFDVMGYGPDLLDEHEMYAALMGHIASKGF